MAFDQVSLFLYPPRWERRSTSPPDGPRHIVTGKPVLYVSTVRVEGVETPVVRVEDLRRWLTSRGFEVEEDHPESPRFAAAAIESALGRRPEIDVCTEGTGGEVASLYYRFLLSRDSPLRLARWDAFFRELCEAFHLRIGVADGEFAAPEEFSTIVRCMDNWRSFADHFGWGHEGREEPV